MEDKVERIFSPVRIGDLTLPHRIVLSPLTRFRGDEFQVPKDIVAQYYEQRATSGGLLITEATSIHPDAAPFEGSPGIYSEPQIKAWKEVATRVHGKGGRIFMQLWHAGRAIHSSLLGGKLPVSSSPVKMESPVRGKYLEAIGRRESDVPRELCPNEIAKIVEHFVTAAENAVLRAGFDGVEVHGANGYLVDQFLRDGVNQRTDSYGGTPENRFRFLFQILEGISSKIGSKKIGIRLNPFGNFNSMSDSNPTSLFTYLFERLNILYPELAYLHLTDYNKNRDSTEKGNDDEVEKLRIHWKGKCILNFNKMSRERAIKLIEERKGDLIAFGRDFLANPDLPIRLAMNYPLNIPDPNTFYTHEAEGYTDYPFYQNI